MLPATRPPSAFSTSTNRGKHVSPLVSRFRHFRPTVSSLCHSSEAASARHRLTGLQTCHLPSLPSLALRLQSASRSSSFSAILYITLPRAARILTYFSCTPYSRPIRQGIAGRSRPIKLWELNHTTARFPRSAQHLLRLLLASAPCQLQYSLHARATLFYNCALDEPRTALIPSCAEPGDRSMRLLCPCSVQLTRPGYWCPRRGL